MQLVTVFGGTGFVGRQVVARLARAGWRVRVGSRNPAGAGFLRVCGDVGQVEPVSANLRDEHSVCAALTGADAAINLVGILAEGGGQRFAAVHGDGAGAVARACVAEGVGRLAHVSAIGADMESPSSYARSKAEGERQVREAMPDAVILRPSIIYGEGDGFFCRFARMAQLSPVIPLVGAATRFQPVHVGDVALAVANALDPDRAGGVYELGGPRIYRFDELMKQMLRSVRRRRLLAPVPFPVAQWLGTLLGLLPNPPLTRDQVRLLGVDNVVASDASTIQNLGVAPVALEGMLDAMLAQFRPGGQYADLTKQAAG